MTERTRDFLLMVLIPIAVAAAGYVAMAVADQYLGPRWEIVT